MEILNNEDFEKCSACGGKCCKNIPGAYHPSDFKPEQLTKEGIIDLIKNHKVTIDCYDDGIIHPFLRPRINMDKCYGFWSFGGVCLHLTPAGCDLSFEDRPFECRSLDPHKCGPNPDSSKKDASDVWEDYAYIIRSVINEMNLSLTCNSYGDYKSEPKVIDEVNDWKEKYPELDDSHDECKEMKRAFDACDTIFRILGMGGIK